MENPNNSQTEEIIAVDQNLSNPPAKKALNPVIPVIGGLLGVSILVGTGIFFQQKKVLPIQTAIATPTQVQQGCTEEMRVCPNGETIIRTGPNCEFQECPTTQATPTTSSKAVIDERPIGSLPYSYISHVTTNQDWVEQGINTRSNSLREFVSTNQCLAIYVSDLGPLTAPLESFTAKRFQIPEPISSEYLYETQYGIANHQTITLGATGEGEISYTIVNSSGRAIGIDVTPHKSGKCGEYKNIVKTLIESIQFN